MFGNRNDWFPDLCFLRIMNEAFGGQLIQKDFFAGFFQNRAQTEGAIPKAVQGDIHPVQKCSLLPVIAFPPFAQIPADPHQHRSGHKFDPVLLQLIEQRDNNVSPHEIAFGMGQG